MRIKSNRDNGFKIDGVLIYPGVRNYPLDYKKKHIAYQLSILKSEGMIDFNEIINIDPDKLPFEAEEQANDDVKQPDKKNKGPRKRRNTRKG
jgi:hypothetical protein